jgi:hypothetical protein
MDTTTTPLERLQTMDDFQVVRFFRHWGDGLCEGAITDFETIVAGVPDEIRSSEFTELTDLSDEEAVSPLHPADAAPMARAILEPLAQSPELTPALENALDTFDDDALAVDVILALGLVASVLLIVSTVEFKGTIGSFAINKAKVDPETLKTILSAVYGLSRGGGNDQA